MNVEELVVGVPALLERYPGPAVRVADMPRWRESNSPDVREATELTWVLRFGEELGVVMIQRTRTPSNPFLVFRYALATELPLSHDLAMFVACVNKEFSVGRMYYIEGASMVVIEEIVFGAVLSFLFEPSMQDLIGRIDESSGQAQRLGPLIRARFGGRPVKESEWMLVAAG